MDWLDQLGRTATDETGVAGLLINLLLVLALGQILSWHYRTFAQVLSNKRKFARMFVFVAATTLLMITVVKTSLALSLGLVGALSIIRFRTPIKEPEELAYLFLSIAIGVGLGADQRAVTVVTFAVILIVLGVFGGGPAAAGVPVRTVVEIRAPIAAGTDGGAALTALMPTVHAHCQRVELRRVDSEGAELQASLLVDVQGTDSIAALLSAVPQAIAGSSVSVIEYEGLE